jgi:hypothetical protein
MYADVDGDDIDPTVSLVIRLNRKRSCLRRHTTVLTRASCFVSQGVEQRTRPSQTHRTSLPSKTWPSRPASMGRTSMDRLSERGDTLCCAFPIVAGGLFRLPRLSTDKPDSSQGMNRLTRFSNRGSSLLGTDMKAARNIKPGDNFKVWGVTQTPRASSELDSNNWLE